MKHLDIRAGTQAFSWIEQNGINPQDVQAMLGASGGPKWFVLSALDQWLCENWLPKYPEGVELIGSSIGAWRMACYSRQQATVAIQRLSDLYSREVYDRPFNRQQITDNAELLLERMLKDTQADETRKLTLIAAKSKGFSRSDRNFLLLPALACVAMGNAISRRSLALWFDRLVMTEQDDSLVGESIDFFKSERIKLKNTNLKAALLSTAAIPVALNKVTQIEGAKPGVYRDGGLVDYHFDLDLDLQAKQKDGWIFYPHFSPVFKPGWFDKKIKRRTVKSHNYRNILTIYPNQAFVDQLPYGKIPDRKDFENMDDTTRMQYWNKVISMGDALVDDWQEFLQSPDLGIISRW